MIDLVRDRPGTLVAVHFDSTLSVRSWLVLDGPPRGALYSIGLGLGVALFGLFFPDLL